MTVRQLFKLVSFDHIIPYIKQSDQPNDVSCYKQAYDILLHTSPCEEDCCCVDVSIYTAPDGTKHVSASQIEGNRWSTYIDGEIVLERSIDISDEELAYRLLWHLTFYGYSHEEVRETIDSMGNDQYHDNVFGKKAREIDHKRTLLWANKAIRKRIHKSIDFHTAQGMNTIYLSEEDWNYIEHHEQHCNRMKRIRDHRLAERLEYLANKDRCENTTQKLLERQIDTKVTRENLAFLDNANGRRGTEFQSRSYNEAARLEYLLELIDKYDALDVVKNIERIVVRIATSPLHPTTELEYKAITEKLYSMTGRNDTIFIKAENDKLDEEMALMVIGIPKCTSQQR